MSADKYIIEKADDISKIREAPDGDFVIINDIDFEGESIKPISSFRGTINGRGHTLRNIRVSFNKHSGLIINNYGTVKNLVVENFRGEGNKVGLIAYHNKREDGLIENCSVSGKLGGLNLIGGIVGVNSGGDIKNCEAQVSTFDIEKDSERDIRTGGIAAENKYDSVIDNCSSKSFLHGTSQVGGIVSLNYGEISNSLSESWIGGGDTCGGIVGSNTGKCSDCRSNCFIEAEDKLGGIVGVNSGYVYDCSSIGLYNGMFKTGGLVGLNVGDIKRCYSEAKIHKPESPVKGRLVGMNCEGSSVHNSYSVGDTDDLENIGRNNGKTSSMGVVENTDNIDRKFLANEI